MVKNWTNDRLTRLYERYRRKYWPCGPGSRRLRTFRVEIASLGDAYGMCDFETRRLLIDVAEHRSDREVRATLLHEMVHAVIGRGGHNAPFWEQLEYLLRENAPVTVGFPEFGEASPSLCVIPKRFRRCRTLFAPVFRRHQREVERKCEGEYDVTEAMFEQECEDAAMEGVPWRQHWKSEADKLCMSDLDGRCLPWAKKYRKAGYRGYRRGQRRRDSIFGECREEYEALRAARREQQ